MGRQGRAEIRGDGRRRAPRLCACRHSRRHRGAGGVACRRHRRASCGRAARDAGQHHQPRQAPGRRLGHHPTGRQELPPEQPGHARPQGPRGHPGLSHRGDLLQGAHPRALSQRDLSRLGQLRRRPGGAQLFRPFARRAQPVGDRLSRGPAQGAQPLQHRPQRARGPRPPRLRPAPHAGGRLPHRRGRHGRPRGEAGAAPPRRHRISAGRVLRRGSAPQPACGLWREGPLRERHDGHHDPQPRHPGRRRHLPARGADRLRPPPRLARPARQDRRHVGQLGGRAQPHRPAPAALRPADVAARGREQGRGAVGPDRGPAGPDRRCHRQQHARRRRGRGHHPLRRDGVGAADAGRPAHREPAALAQGRGRGGRRDHRREGRQARARRQEHQALSAQHLRPAPGAQRRRRRGGDGPADRPRARHVGRLGLWPQPVQPPWTPASPRPRS